MGPTAILYVIPRMGIGGTPTHLLEVVRHLDRQRFSPILCCLTTDRGDSPHLLEKVRELEVPIIDAGIHDTANALVRPHTFRQMYRVAQLMRKSRVQVVHSYLFHANWFGTLTARLARVPVAIVSKRSLDAYTRRKDRWACRVVNRLADCVTANANRVRDNVQSAEGCPIEKIVVIPNGIDLHRTRYQGGLEQLLPSDPCRLSPVIGTVGRLSWKKGQADFLNAAVAVLTQRPDVRFCLVGDGPLRGELESEARRLKIADKVSFLGEVTDGARCLSQMDIFVMPSHMEGMSNSLLEAMAAGLPVVATDVGGNPEVVEDGRTGIVVPSRSPAKLADAILSVLNDPHRGQRMGVAGRERIEKHYTVQIMVDRMQDLYQNLLGDRGIVCGKD